MFHEAAQLPKSCYPLDMSKGFLNAPQSPLPRRQAARFIVWDARLAAEDGRSDDAFRSLMDCLCFARSLEGHPYPGVQSLRETLFYESAFATEQVINRVRLTSNLSALQLALHQAQQTDWIKNSMMCERVPAIEMEGLMPKAPFWYLFLKRGEDRTYSYWCFLLYPQKGLLAYLDVMDRYVAAESLPPPSRLAKEIQIANEVQSNRSYFGKWSPPPPDWAEFTSRDARSKARLLTTEVALAIERYRFGQPGQNARCHEPGAGLSGQRASRPWRRESPPISEAGRRLCRFHSGSPCELQWRRA